MSLAERLQWAIERRGCSQADLARAAEVKQPSVANWLSGETKSLRAEPAIRAAAFLGVSPQWLIEGIGAPEPAAARGHRATIIGTAPAEPPDPLDALAAKLDAVAPALRDHVIDMVRRYLAEPAQRAGLRQPIEMLSRPTADDSRVAESLPPAPRKRKTK
jgi:transcriptional regulator with XRE-family HTH domain